MNKPLLIINEECSISRQITSCHECCRATTSDGLPNITGKLHRAKFETLWGLDCRKCPIHIKSREDGDFREVLASMDATT